MWLPPACLLLPLLLLLLMGGDGGAVVLRLVDLVQDAVGDSSLDALSRDDLGVGPRQNLIYHLEILSQLHKSRNLSYCESGLHISSDQNNPFL